MRFRGWGLGFGGWGLGVGVWGLGFGGYSWFQSKGFGNPQVPTRSPVWGNLDVYWNILILISKFVRPPTGKIFSWSLTTGICASSENWWMDASWKRVQLRQGTRRTGNHTNSLQIHHVKELEQCDTWGVSAERNSMAPHNPGFRRKLPHARPE